jgi:hypothetical protein
MILKTCNLLRSFILRVRMLFTSMSLKTGGSRDLHKVGEPPRDLWVSKVFHSCMMTTGMAGSQTRLISSMNHFPGESTNTCRLAVPRTLPRRLATSSMIFTWAAGGRPSVAEIRWTKVSSQLPWQRVGAHSRCKPKSFFFIVALLSLIKQAVLFSGGAGRVDSLPGRDDRPDCTGYVSL